MAEKKTYVTKVSRFGYMRNREQVEKAALNGQIVPPITEYLPQGSRVELSEDHAKKLIDSGVIEEPGASQRAEMERLKAREAELQRQRDELNAQQKQVEQERQSVKKG